MATVGLLYFHAAKHGYDNVDLQNGRIANALAQMLVCRIVCKPSELILHSFRQRGINYHRILSLLVRKIGIKVCNVQDGFLLLTMKTKTCVLRYLLTTLGLNGGCIFLASSLQNCKPCLSTKIWTYLFQSIYLEKNGCRLISSAPLAPKRRDGSR